MYEISKNYLWKTYFVSEFKKFGCIYEQYNLSEWSRSTIDAKLMYIKFKTNEFRCMPICPFKTYFKKNLFIQVVESSVSTVHKQIQSLKLNFWYSWNSELFPFR